MPLVPVIKSMKTSAKNSSEEKVWVASPPVPGILAALQSAKGSSRLHHAYIFAGPAGVGKQATAVRFAGELLAAPSLFGAADSSASENRILRKNHPDFIWLEPEEGAIRVEQVRELQKALSYAPLEAEWRVVLIESAQLLNLQAANAILKILEEPPANTLFILLCTDSLQLLSTIRSRCQEIRFPPLSTVAISASIAIDSSAALAAEGSLFRAQKLLLETENSSLRQQAAEILLQLWQAEPRISSQALAFVEKHAAEPEQLEIIVDAWNALLRDASIIVGAGADIGALELYFPGYASECRNLAKKLPEKFSAYRLASKLSLIYRFREQRKANVNARLALEALLLGLQLQ